MAEPSELARVPMGAPDAELDPAARAARPGLRQAFSSLSGAAFRWWFFSQIFSASGTMTQGVAQSWLVLRLTGSGVDLGLVTACTFGPMLLTGVWAGALVDRLDRRRLLLGTQSCLLAVSAALGALTVLGTIRLWMVFAGALAAGLVNAIDQPARQIFVLELVGRERTANAVSLNEVVLNASRVLGPAAGGTLLATTGASGCFLLNAASYVPPLLVLWRVHPRERVVVQAPRRGQARAGLAYAWSQRPIRAVLVLAAMAGGLFNLGVALPLLATRVFHQGGGGYGVMMGAFGIGAIGGALAAAADHAWPSGRSVRILALASGVFVLATAAAPDLGAALAGLACCGFTSIWFIARANALAQLRAVPAMRGRVMGVWGMALPGMNPLTGLLAGLVAEDVGIREGFGLAGVGLLAAALAGWRALSDRQGVAEEADGG